MRPSRLLVDALIVLWAAAWIATGLAVANEVRDLARLSDTIVTLGQATQGVGETLDGLGSLPLVGDRVREPAASIREAGDDAIRSGRESRRSAERLGLLLGVSVALIPSIGLLGYYLPTRLAGARERRAVKRALRRGDPALDEYLALRAVGRLRADQLGRLGERPFEAVLATHRRMLADSELRRHGLGRRR